ncbi:YfiR family protein [Sphingobium sp. C100]|uniref:YfiR family protein n=1 Tax=Sphingobium sp. C100 TaxID=1207055 RepID=UPI001F2EE899|nr:YfiR family protein [Sphingobium sp. C100]
MSGLRALLFWLLLSMTSAVQAAPLIQPVMMPVGAGADAVAVSTARMVGAVLEYTRWPEPRSVIRLCLAGTPRHAGRLEDVQLASGAALQLSSLTVAGELPMGRCDALYIGRLDAALTRRLIMAAHGQPVVTIAEDDPNCRNGAMFCLLFAPRTLSFQLSIDAVSRSAVRIDPRVLRLSKGGY